jgi:predicted metal-dependent hydrolase
LRFNWRIIMAPMAIVDYVVAHEVCHLKVHNHSNAFWKLLRKLMPDYEQRREQLRKLGVQFHL